MTDIERMIRMLRRDDRATLAERAARAMEVSFPPTRAGMLFMGGEEVFEACNDARSAYISGLWMATILTAQVAVQRTLAAELHVRNNEQPTDSAGFVLAIQHLGFDEGFSTRLAELITMPDKYRQHPGFTVQNQRTMNDTVAKDARTAIHTMMDYFFTTGKV